MSGNLFYGELSDIPILTKEIAKQRVKLNTKQKEIDTLWNNIHQCQIDNQAMWLTAEETTKKNIRLKTAYKKLQEENEKFKKSLMFKLFSCFN